MRQCCLDHMPQAVVMPLSVKLLSFDFISPQPRMKHGEFRHCSQDEQHLRLSQSVLPQQQSCRHLPHFSRCRPSNASTSEKWWNASNQSLQTTVVSANQAPFLSHFAGGPIFNATYTTPSIGTPASVDVNQIDSSVTPVNNAANAKKNESGGARQSTSACPCFLTSAN